MDNFEKELDGKNEYIIDLYTLFQDVVKGIRKFGWLLIVLVIISVGVSCIITNRSYSPYYEASATFTVNLNYDSGNNSIYEDSLKAYQMSKTFPYIITSGILKSLIATDLGLASISETISAENVEETNLFTLKVTSNNAQRASDILKSLIQNYPKVAVTVVGSTHLNMLDETGTPKEPANQLNYRNSVLIGLLAGAFAGFFIVLIYALTRRTIHKFDDLAKSSNLKQLGTLPEVILKKMGENNYKAVSLLNEKMPPWYRESIYKIRTRVEKIMNLRGMKSILITSAIPGEGKSTFAINMALAMAEDGKKVILIDCDLRHPSIINILSLQNGNLGIDKVLTGEVELTEALNYYDKLKYCVIAGNEPNQNAAEILGSPKMKEILTQLEKTFDYIIIDTAPSAIMADTAELAKFVDGVIFIVKQDYSNVSQILDGLEHLTESSNIEIIGCVLNIMKEGLGVYDYGNYGRYGRYGRYGYGKKKIKSELQI